MIIEFNKSRDKIAIIAPTGRITEIETKFKNKCKLLEDKGFKLTFNKDLFSEDVLPFFAVPRVNRLKDLQDAILDPEVKIILAARGGSGCSEIVFDCLNLQLPNPKILIGFSDITSLHVLFNQIYHLPTIHGEVLSRLDEHKLLSLIETLSGRTSVYEVTPINDLATINDRAIDGSIIGGNLTVFTHKLATSLHPKTSGHILFFEDVNEKGYKIHRDLVHLKNAGIFTNVKAIIFGDFSGGDENVENAITHFTHEHLEIPTYRVRGIGHTEVNHPLVLGFNSSISNGILTCLSPFRIIE